MSFVSGKEADFWFLSCVLQLIEFEAVVPQDGFYVHVYNNHSKSSGSLRMSGTVETVAI